MKSLLLVLFFKSSAFASIPKLVSGQISRYPSAEMSYYLTEEIESSILEKSQNVCGSLKINKVSNITVQVNGNFEVNDGKTNAISGLVPVVYTALVTCK